MSIFNDYDYLPKQSSVEAPLDQRPLFSSPSKQPDVFEERFSVPLPNNSPTGRSTHPPKVPKRPSRHRRGGSNPQELPMRAKDQSTIDAPPVRLPPPVPTEKTSRVPEKSADLASRLTSPMIYINRATEDRSEELSPHVSTNDVSKNMKPNATSQEHLTKTSTTAEQANDRHEWNAIDSPESDVVSIKRSTSWIRKHRDSGVTRVSSTPNAEPLIPPEFGPVIDVSVPKAKKSKVKTVVQESHDSDGDSRKAGIYRKARRKVLREPILAALLGRPYAKEARDKLVLASPKRKRNLGVGDADQSDG